ncbi:hypothetical protein HMPREF9431_00030 [Segatella oulorum F0390]|uniref:Uncharacterized protein n=1 Tax=Segatella oulorum F0390 TaxID=702438 RepID=G1W879_9BACT|nr:hypothetical protein HMPREF9431_00030 [Segatella oulorum F0390]
MPWEALKMRRTSQQMSTQATFFRFSPLAEPLPATNDKLQILQRFAFFVLQGEYKKIFKKGKLCEGVAEVSILFKTPLLLYPPSQKQNRNNAYKREMLNGQE